MSKVRKYKAARSKQLILRFLGVFIIVCVLYFLSSNFISSYNLSQEEKELKVHQEWTRAKMKKIDSLYNLESSSDSAKEKLKNLKTLVNGISGNDAGPERRKKVERKLKQIVDE